MSQLALAPDPRHQIRVDYHNLVDVQFLQRVLDEKLLWIRGDGWITQVLPEQAPGNTIACADYSRAGRLEVLVELDRAVAHLVLVDLALHIRVAAADEDACYAALAAVREAMPPDEGAEEQVPVSFWWWESASGAQELGRMMRAPRWADIAANYSERTTGALEEMTCWDAAAAVTGGRLILWHGPPGTGKTTAVRALAREWRGWADFHFITDPELFLDKPAYLLNAISGRTGPYRGEKWRVLVLEDAGEFLTAGAKFFEGQAVSRLLNVCDGALGQATRSLVLITTNEPVGDLEPALVRPGRCAADVEFRELTHEEIARWCGKRGIDVPSARRAALADLFAHAEGRGRVRQAREFGFAAAV